MKKILFLIHDLGQGGAEKVLVNLVNNMDRSKFEIHVTALFAGGLNEQFLKEDIKYKTIFNKVIPGNSKLMKLFTPRQLYKVCIKEEYDIIVSYLEGPSARVVSGCDNPNTKLVSWIHVEQHTMGKLAASFRGEAEAVECYNRFDQTICVSRTVLEDFSCLLDFKKPIEVLYNTVESKKILELANTHTIELVDDNCVRLVAVGTLKESKGYMRLLEIIKTLKDNQYRVHLYVLGVGALQKKMEAYIDQYQLHDAVTLLGYHTNPYRIVKNCDLFVCASFAEGFSTAATEALIVGTPVCTVEVSGMKEMLGDNNEYGIVTDNDENALYEGIKALLDNPELLEHYKQMAVERGKSFRTENTVNAVEFMLLNLVKS